jgi:hypothetical protein
MEDSEIFGETRDSGRRTRCRPRTPDTWRGLRNYLERQREWSERTFGTGRRTKGVIEHIRRELLEIEAEPGKLEEWVDVVILALDGARRAGHSAEAVIGMLCAKQAVNFKRKYPEPVSEDIPVEHIRENVNCMACGYSGDISTYRPSLSVYSDCRCPNCGSTSNAHNDRYLADMQEAMCKTKQSTPTE